MVTNHYSPSTVLSLIPNLQSVSKRNSLQLVSRYKENSFFVPNSGNILPKIETIFKFYIYYRLTTI